MQATAWAALSGIGLALVIPCVQAIVAELYSPYERGRAFGVLFTVSALGMPPIHHMLCDLDCAQFCNTSLMSACPRAIPYGGSKCSAHCMLSSVPALGTCTALQKRLVLTFVRNGDLQRV